TPRYLMTANATPLACSRAASPVMAASRCGTIPSVQANAASTLARGPRDRPADSVKSAPVPGVATMTSDVTRKVQVTGGSLVLGAVAAGLDVVAVGVAHERAVVGRVVLRPDLGLVQRLRALPKGGREELTDRGPVRSPEGQMALPESVAGGLGAEPERRVL